jgi:tetratricopeptide (TPR) repeat protein
VLKGLSDPVPTVEVRWERAPAQRLPFPELLGTSTGLPFTGRLSELDLLGRAWKDASAGERHCVLVGGEPGVGKTRLAAELARRIYGGGGAVLYGRCEENLGVPYEPFVEALGYFCQQTAAPDLRLGRYPGELTRLVPDLGALVPGLDPPLRSDPETEQYRLFEAVASWLSAAAEATGLVFVVDDLHWAPPPTIQLLAHLLRAAGPARLLVVANFRDTEVGPAHPLSAFLADLRRHSPAERIALEGLSVDELTELLGGLPETPRSLAATLHEGTEGNPFFVGELLRSVADSGVAVEALPVPEGVRDVIVSRVGRLSTATRELLGVASLLGRDLEVTPLAGVARTSEEDAARAMEEALSARLVEETGVGTYRFVHALVRSALYEGLSATRRARLHLRAADVFEQQGDENPATLAHHLVSSAPLGDRARTASACLAAGDRALSVLADAEAGEWYSRGLAFSGDDSILRIDLLTGLGEAQRRTGDPASRQTLIDASCLAVDHGDVTRLVRAVLTNSRGFYSGAGHVDEERLDLIATALDLLGPAPSAERAELLALQAAELVFADDHERRLRVADEAAAIADRLEDLPVRARVGVRRSVACLVPDRMAAMVSEGEDVVGLADASGDPQLRVMARVVWTPALLAAGHLREARRRTAEAMAIADDTGQPGLRSFAHLHYAGALDALGDHEEAQRLSQAACELGQEASWPDALMFYGARIWLHWTFEGQPEVAAAVAAQAFAEYPKLVAWQGAWALAIVLGGGGEEAAGVLASVPNVPVDMFWLITRAFFAAAQGFGVEDPQTAGAVYERLLPYRALHAGYGIGYLGPVEMALAVAARVMGDVESALAHHDAAAATIEACGAARARAFNGYQWARTLLARDAPGDRQRSAELAEETLAYCKTKGYTTFVTKTEELLAGL